MTMFYINFAIASGLLFLKVYWLVRGLEIHFGPHPRSFSGGEGCLCANYINMLLTSLLLKTERKKGQQKQKQAEQRHPSPWRRNEDEV